MILLLTSCFFRFDPNEGTTDSGETVVISEDVPTLFGARGSEGVLLWHNDPGSWVLQHTDGSGWTDQRADAAPWLDPAAPEKRSYRLRASDSEEVGDTATLSTNTTTLSAVRTLLLSGEAVDLTVSSVGTEDADLSLGLQHTDDGRWLDVDCLASVDTPDPCWTADFISIPHQAELTWSAEDTEQVPLTLAATRLDGRGDRVTLSSSAVTIIQLGRSIAWGDPHAHSNLSQDGCEVYEDSCRSREETAAADFFAQAIARGLDWAAITDHAEYSYLYPEGTEDEYIIWQQQQDLALAADDGTFLPLIGYEWTNLHGHRSVIFEQISACGAFRVSGKAEPEDVVRLGIGDTLIADNPIQALTPPDLWAALDEAAKSCATSRVFSIPHHTAMRLPEPVVWEDDLNTPDLRYERLVEITSEHGTSECIDLDAENCRYRIKTIGGYSPEGSIQTMLQLGYDLGFIGGTDSHDSRPGSTEDDPSCVSLDGEGDVEIPCHEYPGGLTGVMYAGRLDRESLFDGLEARNTLAVSAVPVDARAVLVSDDALYFPGDDVPAGTYTLHVDVPTDQASVLSIEAMDQDGDRRHLMDAPIGSAALELAAGDAVYLRVRMEIDGTEERIWVSPFFGY